MVRRVVTWALLGGIATLSPAVHAELSVDPGAGTRLSTIIMGIGEGSDPFPSLWESYRQIPVERMLNAAGAVRGDGRPDVAWSDDGRPLVVWAYNNGPDHDVAFAEWTGASWSPAEFLTSAAVDELDPRVFVEADGTVHVVWWEAGAVVERVLAVTRDVTGTWGLPVEVTADGRRPAVGMWNGVLRVGWERDAAGAGVAQEVVVARREANGSFTPEVVAQTARTLRLDTILHVEAGRLWVDWKHAAGEIGYAERGPVQWTAPATKPWTDTSWSGVEAVRRAIRHDLLNGN